VSSALFAQRVTFVVAIVLFASAAQGEPSVDASPSRLERAAAAFDSGVRAFEKAEFVAAARQFLSADELVPNTDALYNALSAAQKGKHDALIATAAARAASREAAAPELAARARSTLADVERRVARLVLSCQPTPCELMIDGEHAVPGTNYALPGARRVVARGTDGALAEREVQAVASGEQTVVLDVVAAPSEPVAPSPVPEKRALQSPPEPRGDAAQRKDQARKLSPAFFYTGAGVTLALAGLTAWSGVDTLNAKQRLPGTASDNEAVLARAHRTDALLVGTVVVGAATAAVGLAWTDWGQSGSRVALESALGERGAALRVAGTF
jgi:hypothetical protein